MPQPDVDEIREFAVRLDPDLAKAVSRWEIEVGEDWLGELAIHVAVVFKDSEIRRVWTKREAFRKRLREGLRALAPDCYPFVRFDAESVALDPEQPARA
jgi:hypothetical protein